MIDHAAVLDIERQPELFTNGPEPVLQTDFAMSARQLRIKTLIHMDDVEHTGYRKLTADWVQARGGPPSHRPARPIEPRGALDHATTRDGRCDFAVDVALPYPLQVILEILGLPETDYERMLTLTQQLFGGEDPDLQRAAPSPEVQAEVIGDFFSYFTALTSQRREHPSDDLATLIANGTIADEPLGDLETMGYYMIIATAGHDTTSSAMAGGLRALFENPDLIS